MMTKGCKRLLRIFWIVSFLLLPSGVITTQAAVESSLVKTLHIGKRVLDMTATVDGKLLFVLTRGEVLVYNARNQKLSGRISVDPDINRITISPRGNQLFASNGKTKTLSVVNVNLVYDIDAKGVPFKGPADAPVVIAVFDDYQ
ncbi:MAG: hypothetical protein GXP58_01205 [Deltaproteobacteria bacterium]|nr:hypothetical protein [Deltaproteobacteria bacterium]